LLFFSPAASLREAFVLVCYSAYFIMGNAGVQAANHFLRGGKASVKFSFSHIDIPAIHLL
jgi:hypothetical protein